MNSSSRSSRSPSRSTSKLKKKSTSTSPEKTRKKKISSRSPEKTVTIGKTPEKKTPERAAEKKVSSSKKISTSKLAERKVGERKTTSKEPVAASPEKSSPEKSSPERVPRRSRSSGPSRSARVSSPEKPSVVMPDPTVAAEPAPEKLKRVIRREAPEVTKIKREPAKIAEPVKVNLGVPFIPQNGSFDCWHAALRMLFAFRDGPDGKVPGYPKVLDAGLAREAERAAAIASAKDKIDQKWKLRDLPSRGLGAKEFATLAELNGLRSVDLPDPDVGFTSDQLADLVKANGPLWCALRYFHVVVVKGVDADGQIVTHDPQGGADRLYPINGFNQTLAWTANAVMYLPPH